MTMRTIEMAVVEIKSCDKMHDISSNHVTFRLVMPL